MPLHNISSVKNSSLRLRIQPVGNLDGENVVGLNVEEGAQVASEVKLAFIGKVSFLVCPNEVQRRAGEIFPSEDCIDAK